MSVRTDALRGLRAQELADKRNAAGGKSNCSIFNYSTWDADWIFAYPTTRVVYIRYRWLGIFKKILDVCILCYLIVLVFGYYRFHHIKDTPQIYGTFTPKNATLHNAAHYDYCHSTYLDYLNWLERDDTGNPEKYPCVKLLEENMFTNVNFDSATIVTHTQEWRHRIKADETNQITATNEYYTLGVEDMEFEFSFVFQCPRLFSAAVVSSYYNRWQNSSDHLEGYICSSSGSCDRKTNMKKLPKGPKTLKVSDLIKATGKNHTTYLNQPCADPNGYNMQFDPVYGVSSIGYKLNTANTQAFKLRRCGVIFEISIIIEQTSMLQFTGFFSPKEFEFFVYVDIADGHYSYSVETTGIAPTSAAVTHLTVTDWYERKSQDPLKARYVPTMPVPNIVGLNDVTPVNESTSADDEVYLRYVKRGITLRLHGGPGMTAFAFYRLVLCLVSVFVLFDIANYLVDWVMVTFIPSYSPLFYRAKYEFSADLGDLKTDPNLDMQDVFLKSKQKQLGQARGAIEKKMRDIQKKANQWRRKCMYLFDEVNEVFRVAKYRHPETTDILNQLTQNIIQGWSKLGPESAKLQRELAARDPDEEFTVQEILKFDPVRFAGVPKPPDDFKTIVFVPSVSMKWNMKAQNFATQILEEYNPEKFRYVQILGVGKRRDVKAAEVECRRTLNRPNLDAIRRSIEVFEEQYPLASKFAIRPCMDVLITEMKKFVDKVDPHQKGFVLQNNFRELMSLTSQMNLKKMDHFYNLLKNKSSRSGKNPGVDLNAIVNLAYTRGENENRSNPTEAINWAVRELAKEALAEKKRRAVRRTGSEHEM